MRGKKWVHASGWSNGPISNPFTRPFHLSPMSTIQVMHVELHRALPFPQAPAGSPFPPPPGPAGALCQCPIVILLRVPS